MKTLLVLILTLPAISFAAVHPTPATGTEEAKDFSEYYAEWNVLLISKPMPPEALGGDPRPFFYDNKPFADIVSLGLPALPDILEAGRSHSILLEAFHRITKWSYRLVRTGGDGSSFEWSVEGHPETKTYARKSHGPPSHWTVCALWWTDWRFQTEHRFNELHMEREEALLAHDFASETNCLRKIQELSLPALPFLVDHYADTPEYLETIENLTNKQLPPQNNARPTTHMVETK